MSTVFSRRSFLKYTAVAAVAVAGELRDHARVLRSSQYKIRLVHHQQHRIVQRAALQRVR